MKFSSHVVLVAAGTANVAAHSIFQQLWVDGVDVCTPISLNFRIAKLTHTSMDPNAFACPPVIALSPALAAPTFDAMPAAPVESLGNVP